MPEVQRKLVDTGRIRLIVRDFPLNAPALEAAALVRCLPEGRRPEAHRLLLSRMSDWTGEAPARMAAVVGLSGAGAETALACAALPETRNAIIAKAQAATLAYNVHATPSFVINGQIVTGAIPEADIERLVDSTGASAATPVN
jgi:protein-disulfide isomerase